MEPTRWRDEVYDYIVVGSGAGGGPVAANLARAGYKVALLEAGGSDNAASYEVPAFYGLACESEGLRWDYVVHHYDDPVQEHRDSKARNFNGEFGVWYPRSGTLGGCTAHHALVAITPNDSDWNAIADLTGDASWRAEEMQQYFTRIERCNYVRPPNFGRPHPGGHGFTGWLSTNIARPQLLTRDWKIVRIVWATLATTIKGKIRQSLRYAWDMWRRFPGGPIDFLASLFDPNDGRHAAFGREGLFYVPFSTELGRRVSIRDLLNLMLQDYRDNLTIYTRTLCTRVLFEETGSPSGPKAIGVEVMEGLNLYQADPRFDPSDPLPPREGIRARNEVIVACGAFNSPQLLMLSGIGPKDELKAHGIDLLLDRPGVGKNLQDRYEVGVVCRTIGDFTITRGACFRRPGIGEEPDPQFAEWLHGTGPYTTNGIAICITKKSDPSLPEPDLFMFCVPGVFRGYYPGWTKDIADNKTQFSWLILKSHTHNRAGSVTLRSADPAERPTIAFRYFDTSVPGADADLDAVVDGIEHARTINRKVESFIAAELFPGPDYPDRAALREYVRNEAWGHHASCSNAMGLPTDPMAVVDSKFRVIGARALRVVDASVFPRIPGFFIVAPIYMIAEKASDDIIAAAPAPARSPVPS